MDLHTRTWFPAWPVIRSGSYVATLPFNELPAPLRTKVFRLNQARRMQRLVPVLGLPIIPPFRKLFEIFHSARSLNIFGGVVLGALYTEGMMVRDRMVDVRDGVYNVLMESERLPRRSTALTRDERVSPSAPMPERANISQLIKDFVYREGATHIAVDQVGNIHFEKAHPLWHGRLFRSLLSVLRAPLLKREEVLPSQPAGLVRREPGESQGGLTVSRRRRLA